MVNELVLGDLNSMDPGSSQQGSARVALTQEEMRILLQCNKDAFWQRSLPFMVAFAGSTHMLVKMGYLYPHPVRGSLYKVLASAAVGWMIGKMSFRGECQRRIMEQLPNSRLAEMVRARQTPGVSQYQGQPVPDGPIIVPPPKADVDFGPPQIDEQQQSQTALSTGSSAVTYDELRRRHHSEALQQQQQQLARQQQELSQPIQQKPLAPAEEVKPGKNRRVNKYGDAMDTEE